MADYARSSTPTIQSTPRGSSWVTLLGTVGIIFVLFGRVGVQIAEVSEGTASNSILLIDNIAGTIQVLLELAIVVVIVVSIAKALRSHKPARVYERGALVVAILAAGQVLLLAYRHLDFYVRFSEYLSVDISPFVLFSLIPFTNLCLAVAAVFATRIARGKYPDGSLRRKQLLAHGFAGAALIFPALTLEGYIETIATDWINTEYQMSPLWSLIWQLLALILQFTAVAFGCVAILRATTSWRASGVLPSEASGPAAGGESVGQTGFGGQNASGDHAGWSDDEASQGSVLGQSNAAWSAADTTDEWASLPVVIPASPLSHVAHLNERLSTPKQNAQTFVDLSRASVWVIAAGGVACVAAVATAFSDYLSYGAYTFDDISDRYVISMLNLDGIGVSMVIIALGIALGCVPKSVFDQLPNLGSRPVGASQ